MHVFPFNIGHGDLIAMGVRAISQDGREDSESIGILS